MKILDIRGNLIKIESSKPVGVSSLLKISDKDNNYVAQVLYVENSAASYMLFAKLLAYFDSPLAAVNIQNLSKDALCEKLNSTDIVSNLGKNKDIIFGELAYETGILTADKGILDNKILIAAENPSHASLIISNLAWQIQNLGYNTLIFDTNGTSEGVKLTAGVDFKLPLNAHAVEFIYNKYFSDITDESRAIVNSIFSELREYASTVPYIPFGAFKSVIDEVLDYSNNMSLFFFKTKLEKLAAMRIFANSHDEVMDWTTLSEYGPGTIVINLAQIPGIFISEYISLILESFKNTDIKIYAFAKLADNFINKELVKEIIENTNVITSCVVNSNCRFLSAFKQNFSGMIVFGGIKKPDNFDYCKFLLKNLQSDKYIYAGKYSAPYSFIFQLKEITEVLLAPDKKSKKILTETNVTNNEETFSSGELKEAVNQETLENKTSPSAPDEPETAGEYEPLPVVEEEPVVEITDYTPEENVADEQNSASAKENPPGAEAQPEPEYQEPVEELPVQSIMEPQVVSEDESDITEDVKEQKLEAIDMPSVEQEYETLEVVDAAPIEQPAEPKQEYSTAEEKSVSTEEAAVVEEYADDLTDGSSEEEMPLYEPVEPPLQEDDSELELEEEIPELSVELEEQLDFTNDISDSSVDNSDTLPVEEDDNTELRFAGDNSSDEELSLASNEQAEGVSEVADDETVAEKTPEELLDEEIRRDVDKVYMAPHQDDSDELSEDDLDFIEELVGSDDIELEETSPEDDLNAFTDDYVAEHSDLLPEEDQLPKIPSDDGAVLQQRNTAAPAVPIYTAEIPEDALVHSDPIQQGDRVIHVKFGVGVVEKIFSYGTKNFCSINFENIGRKVLDPNITELKKA